MAQMNELDKLYIMKELARLAKMLDEDKVSQAEYLKEKEKLMDKLRKFNPSIK